MAAFKLLGIEYDADKSAVRAAYIQKMKLLHPDVNQDRDTTRDAAAIVAAYKHLLQVSTGLDLKELDVFEHPETEPTELFVDPFAFSISPMDWKRLQEVARSQPDPEAALMQAGLRVPSAAVVWLTPAQLAVVEQDLAEMEDNMTFELTAFILTDRLSRARFANARF